MSKPNEAEKQALILYSTMTGNTKKIANHLAEALEEKGIITQNINVKNGVAMEDIKKAIDESDAIFFGSSTRYADMVGKLEEVLKELKDTDLSTKMGIAFGSYGWSGEAVEVIQDYLNESNIKTVDSSFIIKTTGMEDISFPIRIKFTPKEKEIEKANKAAQTIADLLIA